MNPNWVSISTLKIQSVFTWKIELRIVRSRRILYKYFRIHYVCKQSISNEINYDNSLKFA